MNVRRFGIVINHADGTQRLFGTVSRSDKGDVYVNWIVDEPPRRSIVPPWKPHASYHASGQVHSKSHNHTAIKKIRQVPGPTFKGNEPVEATNSDRALSASLPVVTETFDDKLEIDVSLISGLTSQAIAVDLVEPGISPSQLTGNDVVLAQKTFSDQIPWIVVRLVQPREGYLRSLVP